MEQEADVDPFVVSSVAERFVAVYVDADRRPELNERYNMGGWPANAFLTPRGELITGGTYFDTDTFRILLERVSQSWTEHRAEVEEAVASIRRDAEQRRRARSAASVPTADDVAAIVDLTMDEFDFRYGGFGREPKFPHPHSIELLLAEFRHTGEERLRDAALITLEALWDPGEGRPRLADDSGGFFRYAARRDWSDARYEKMLDENAQILGVFLSAYQLTGESRWATAARSIVAAARRIFVDARRRLFCWSQSAVDADDYYALEVAARAKVDPPAVDTTAYVAANAQMAAVFVRAGLVLNDNATLELGAAVVDGLVSRARLDGERLLGHVLGPDGPEGPVLLSSQVFVARALVDCYEALGGHARLASAAALLDEAHSRLLDTVRQAYTDTIIELGADGYLSQPIVPLVENSVAADTLLRLALLLDAPAYHSRALGLLKVLAGGVEEYGFVAAPFGLAVLRSLAREPVIVEVAAPPNGDTRSLARAVAAIYSPFKVVRYLEPERDHARLKTLSGQIADGPVAVVSKGAARAEPTRDTKRLVALLARASVR